MRCIKLPCFPMHCFRQRQRYRTRPACPVYNFHDHCEKFVVALQQKIQDAFVHFEIY